MTPDLEQNSEIIAIDGPAGAGKSSVAKAVADALSFTHLDSGAMYRAITWWAMHQSIDMDDPDALITATESIALDISTNQGMTKVFVNGEDISDAVRTRPVTESIKKLDHIPRVRKHLVSLQRAFARKGPTVAEGRDMGTVVFPNAKCKIYLDASVDVRAERRAKQLEQSGATADLEEIRADIQRRDDSDMGRDIAPLQAAEDAHVLDTSEMNQDEVVAAIVSLARAAF